MCTRLSVQIKFTEIESMLFSNIFQWRIHVLDKEGDAVGLSLPPPSPQDVFFFFFLHCFLSRRPIIDTCTRPIQRYIAKTSHIRLPTNLDE